MKTTKILLVMTFVAFTTMIFAQSKRPVLNEEAPAQRSIKISLEKALLDRTLKKVLYQQVTPKILLFGQANQTAYVAKVYHNRTIYYVYGKYSQWKAFFVMDLIEDPACGIAPNGHKKPGNLK